jgi:hypothetical protein
MSLIGFHRFLISAAILFCGVFAAFEFFAYADSGATGTAVLGGTFAVLTIGLVYYLVNLNRFLSRGQADRR